MCDPAPPARGFGAVPRRLPATVRHFPVLMVGTWFAALCLMPRPRREPGDIGCYFQRETQLWPRQRHLKRIGRFALGIDATPTQAEWLCVLLNMDEAAVADVQFPTGTGVRFRHDHTKPDTIQIELLYNVNVPENELRHRAQHAERQAQEVAKLKGWEGWLRTEVTQTKVTRRPVASPLDE